MIDWLIDWLVGWLAISLVARLLGWFIDSFINELADWLVASSVGCSLVSCLEWGCAHVRFVLCLLCCACFALLRFARFCFMLFCCWSLAVFCAALLGVVLFPWLFVRGFLCLLFPGSLVCFGSHACVID